MDAQPAILAQLTIFHVLSFAMLVGGIVLGYELGSRWGVLLAIGGAVIGGLCGLVAGRLPLLLAIWASRWFLRNKTSHELRGLLRDDGFLAPNVVLLELLRRKEDIGQELPVVLEMLESDDVERRTRGWHALATAFPRQTRYFHDYRLDDPTEICRGRVQRFRDGKESSPD
jgi:hypothetical protein